MSKINIACPNCGNKGEVDESHLGRRVQCNKCKTAFVIQKAPEAGATDVTVSATQIQSSAQLGEERVNPIDGAEMVYIPEGEFLMGSDDGPENERPQHTVFLDGYWIYKHPVTAAQFLKFCQATERQMPQSPEWGWTPNHPIVNVNWFDATAYSEWAKARLPNEAEWEKAARGTDGRKFPWGNEWDGSRCRCSKSSTADAKGTAAVGSFPQGVSPYGAHDMAGNVMEWCADWYDEHYYWDTPNRNPQGPSSGKFRVLLGHSWITSGEINFRCSIRTLGNPDLGYNYFGFRCVQGLS